MKRLIVLGIIILVGLIQIAPSQVRGIPPSVTSLAPGRQFIPGPSVTSLGPRGWSDSPVLLGNPRFRGRFGGGPFIANGGGFRHFDRHGRNIWPVFVPMYAPYGMGVYPMIYADPSAGYDTVYPAEPSDGYQGDPNAVTDYNVRPPAYPRTQATLPRPDQEQQVARAEGDAPLPATAPAVKVEPQPKTVLVFKDGHKLEVTNYAIQGQTLFNLGEDGPRKVPISELDVDKTIAENDNHGVVFKLP